jgi:hypothetical protein
MTLDLAPNLLNEFVSTLFGGDGNTFETGEDKEIRLIGQRIKDARVNVCTAVSSLSEEVDEIIVKKWNNELNTVLTIRAANIPQE